MQLSLNKVYWYKKTQSVILIQAQNRRNKNL